PPKRARAGSLDHLVGAGERRRRHVERDFARRALWNVGATADQRQSALMLRARMTLPHFSVSSTMNFPKSAGKTANTVPPRSVSRALILGSARPAWISLLSWSITSTGVFLSAPMPYQAVAS